MNISFVIKTLFIIFIIISVILGIMCSIYECSLEEMILNTPEPIKKPTILLFLLLFIVVFCLVALTIVCTIHYPQDCVADYSECQTQTISKYYEQDNLLYAVVGDKAYLITHKNDDDYIHSDECIVKLNNKYFSNCFVGESETVIYREDKWNWFLKKTVRQNTLYVNNETYNRLLNITPLDTK